MNLELTILTPERRLIEREAVQYIKLPTSEGEIEILPDHAPLVGSLETGVFTYVNTQGQVTSGVMTSGFFEVSNNKVMVSAEVLELEGEIDASRARTAQKKAEDMLKESSLEPHQFEKYQLKLQRSLIRQQLASGSKLDH
jgi:F-type H+-transporting ATPase subunit epsilon